MRRLVLAIVLSLAAGAVNAQSMTVNIDQSVRLGLRAPARDVVISNPSVIDVTMLTPTSLAVLGRGYGVTNLVVTDQLGRTLIERQVVVSSPDENRVSFYRGAKVADYACATRCEPTPAPGADAGKAATPTP